MEETLCLSKLDRIVEEAGEEKGSLIPVLQKAQDVYGYLPQEVLRSISDRLGVSLTKVYGVTTFYSQFHLAPRGRHIVQQCDGTACHVRGAARIIDAVERELGIKAGETTRDRKCTYEVVYCLGSCALAPMAIVDDQVQRELTADKMVDIVKNLE